MGYFHSSIVAKQSFEKITPEKIFKGSLAGPVCGQDAI
jgi:hypothetical protein